VATAFYLLDLTDIYLCRLNNQDKEKVKNYILYFLLYYFLSMGNKDLYFIFLNNQLRFDIFIFGIK